ncbi:ABC transporter ATP-binding protein [uncultured Pontibacter sp.]|uniref:ABC transporter ATP-binding protein n=1 Tax=uncultured Pontibacter sp. TaxID=453356 RepID=UPI00261BB8C4|nr:ABC transporter ATP-binding protein [uncultured Pontibacter sp.]
MKKIIIETVQLEKKYLTDTVETTALAGVDLRIVQGEFVAIMGPSGCGKTTLLNILGLLDLPSGGILRFLDQDVTNASERKRARLRKENLGFVFQSFNLIDELTVQENIELPLFYQGLPQAEIKAKTKEALERIGMSHRHGHFPQQLSGGQQQRVAIARAVVARPHLILADEPTGNLDSQHGREVMQLLAELNSEGATIVMVTHSPTDSEYAYRIINIFDGQVVTERANTAISNIL